MQAVAKSNGALKTRIATWAKSRGLQSSIAHSLKQDVPLAFKLANRLVFSKVKHTLGLDQCALFFFGAAPLSSDIRQYFLSLNIPLINVYGMSESSGPQTITNPRNFDHFDAQYLKSCGSAIHGVEMKIDGPQEGEICYRGRHVFLGYLKNEQATADTIDAEGYLHSGDVGTLDAKGNLSITGRIKELIITAGGENVAPVLIENEVLFQLDQEAPGRPRGQLDRHRGAAEVPHRAADPQASLRRQRQALKCDHRGRGRPVEREGHPGRHAGQCEVGPCV